VPHNGLFGAVTAALSLAIPYAVIAALMTKAAEVGRVHVPPLQALAGAFVLASVCALFGALRETGQLAPLLDRLPDDVRTALRAGLTASAIVVGVAAIAGHVRSVFLLWKGGGKGVATAGGVFLALAPIASLISIAVFALVVYLSGYVSLGSLCSAVVLTVTVVIMAAYSPWLTTVFLATAPLYALGSEVGFAEIVAAASQRGETAFGWRVDATGEVVVNPPKSARTTLGPADQVLVLGPR